MFHYHDDAADPNPQNGPGERTSMLNLLPISIVVVASVSQSTEIISQRSSGWCSPNIA